MNLAYENLPSPSLAKILKTIGRPTKSERKLHFLIFGFFGMKNIGDDILLTQEIEQIKSLGIPYQITVPSESPQLVKKIFNVRSFKIKNIDTFFKQIQQTDIVIFGAGGLICNTGSENKLSKKIIDVMFDLYKCCFLFLLPKILGKKIVVYGIGAYSNIDAIKKVIYINALKLADYISVRDYDSYLFLSQHISSPQVNYEKDLAFLLRSQPKKTSSVTPLIGISLIPSSDQSINQKNVTLFAHLINKYGSKAKFVFFPFLVNERFYNDLDIAKEIQKNLHNQKYLEIIPYKEGPTGFYNLFNQLDFAFCTRFHSQVFAYKQKIPFLGISYDNKCQSFLSAVNAKWVDLKNLDFSILDKRIRRVKGLQIL